MIDMAEANGRDNAPDGGDGGHGTIDVEQIADRVYRLMLAEVRLERARNGESDHSRKVE